MILLQFPPNLAVCVDDIWKLNVNRSKSSRNMDKEKLGGMEMLAGCNYLWWITLLGRQWL